MVGYGSEDKHFVFELVWNKGVTKYNLSDDFAFVEIHSSVAFKNARKKNGISDAAANVPLHIRSPDNIPFAVHNTDQEPRIGKIALSSLLSVLDETRFFYGFQAGMEFVRESPLEVAYKQQSFSLLFVPKNQYKRSDSSGRLAIAYPQDKLKMLERSLIQNSAIKLLTPYTYLPTPGKPSVHVVVVADPNGHEVCFVGDEEFYQLAKVDPQANRLVQNVKHCFFSSVCLNNSCFFSGH